MPAGRPHTEPASRNGSRPTRCGIRLPRIYLKRGPTLRTIQLLLGHAEVRHTVLYLHLSRRHLHAVANPLEALAIPAPETVYKSRRLHKR